MKRCSDCNARYGTAHATNCPKYQLVRIARTLRENEERIAELEAELEKMHDLDSVVTAHWDVLPLDFKLIYGANKEAMEDTQ